MSRFSQWAKGFRSGRVRHWEHDYGQLRLLLARLLQHLISLGHPRILVRAAHLVALLCAIDLGWAGHDTITPKTATPSDTMASVWDDAVVATKFGFIEVQVSDSMAGVWQDGVAKTLI